jgi:hypothetical protein
MADKKQAPAKLSEKTVAAADAWQRDAKAIQTFPLIGLAAIVVVGLYMMFSGGDDEEVAPEVAAAEEPIEETPSPPPVEEPKPKLDLPAEAAGETEGAADTEGEPAEDGGPEDPGGEGVPAATADSGAGKPASGKSKPALGRSKPASGGSKPASGGSKPSAKPEPAPKPTLDPEEQIQAALKAGWMREAAGVLLVFPRNSPMTWDAADKLCRRRKQAGVGGWKLPSVGQLESLRKANALPGGTWWSSTAGAEDTKAQALTVTKSQPEEAAKADAAAMPVCVRKH